MIDRQSILKKLSDYLEGNISKESAYEWALFIAVSKDFEEIADKDPLVNKTIKSLIDIHHDDLKKIPTRKALEYYRMCLAGELEYEPLEESKALHQIEVPDVPEEIILKNPKPKKKKTAKDLTKQYLLLFRIYVLTFSICSLGIHVYSIINPEFLRADELLPTRADAIKESLPHIIYAVLIIIPPMLTARGFFFYLSFPLLTVGMIYYWYISVMIILRLKLNLIFVLVILPFSAIPATLALLLLMMRREEIKKALKNPT